MRVSWIAQCIRILEKDEMLTWFFSMVVMKNWDMDLIITSEGAHFYGFLSVVIGFWQLFVPNVLERKSEVFHTKHIFVRWRILCAYGGQNQKTILGRIWREWYALVFRFYITRNTCWVGWHQCQKSQTTELETLDVEWASSNVEYAPQMISLWTQ